MRLEGHSIDQFGTYIFKSPGNISSDKLAAYTNLCPRQFKTKFIERKGIGPGLDTGMARFNKVCKLKYIYPDGDWLAIALNCGYYDCSHLVWDCKTFAGTMSPDYFFAGYQGARKRFRIHAA